jgi:hypothetical protein
VNCSWNQCAHMKCNARRLTQPWRPSQLHALDLSQSRRSERTGYVRLGSREVVVSIHYGDSEGEGVQEDNGRCELLHVLR